MKIIQKSKLEHPILKSLTKDELDVLKVSIFENITYINTDYIKREAKKYHLVDYVSSFSDGRMESIMLESEKSASKMKASDIIVVRKQAEAALRF